MYKCLTASFLLQYINKTTGFRVCFKELFVAKYDPLSITYAVLPGKPGKCSISVDIFVFLNIGRKGEGDPTPLSIYSVCFILPFCIHKNSPKRRNTTKSKGPQTKMLQK